MRVRDARLTLAQSKRLTNARVLGEATALPIYLDDAELAKIFAVILSDLDQPELAKKLPPLPRDALGDYYKIATKWFCEPGEKVDIIAAYLEYCSAISDFDTYLECLCQLHKRRKKYERILSAQPTPTMVQVAPRALLEYGGKESEALASWIVWRKWLYDIDNRAAQETGYLFEPVLANALGGTAYGARSSPVKRRNDRTKGRQVDCLVDKNAYEFKLRVTIAASGQGRFGEELDFARDCRDSGFNPILLVLDPTPSGRLDELAREYAQFGGRAYIGNDAWTHIETEAGPTMSRFVDRYIRTPIADIDKYAPTLLDLSVSADPDRSAFRIAVGSAAGKIEWIIPRSEDESLSLEKSGGKDGCEQPEVD